MWRDRLVATLRGARARQGLKWNVLGDSRLVFRIVEPVARRIAFGQALPDLPAPAAVSAAELKQWAGVWRAENGDTLELRAEGDRLVGVGRGSSVLSGLYSDGPVDAARLARAEGETRRVVEAYVQGDMGPLHEAYGGRTPVERLREGWERIRGEGEAQFGAFRGVEVIGCWAERDRVMARVAYLFKRGERADVFVFGADDALLGRLTRAPGREERLYVDEAGGLFVFNEAGLSARRFGVEREGEGEGEGAATLTLGGGCALKRVE